MFLFQRKAYVLKSNNNSDNDNDNDKNLSSPKAIAQVLVSEP